MNDVLPPDLRALLGRTVKAARRDAEAGARRALDALAVSGRDPHPGMAPDAQALRRRLRAHGRQLGDRRDPRAGTQEIGRLTAEVACEHWHRMLFARFLAENDLLIEPAAGVAVSLAECEELAREQGADPWVLAGRFAERMLPRIFRSDDPALAVTLAPETRQALEQRVESLPATVFTAGDALGWTYQFWQAERKDAVNRSGAKIGADELPAVTQLFTEPYMVGFLLHNTLGAWRAGRLLAARADLAAAAPDEAALRRAVRLEAAGGYDFAWLRFVRDARDGDAAERPAGPWYPAAGAFEGWPQRAAELRILDPCCGSGHFLVEAFELLVRLRMDEERIALDDAIRAVLRDNLFGLEIDPRCTQIAAFNLALAAWRLAGRPIELPPLNLACSGLAPHAALGEWIALAEDAAAAGGMPANRDLLGVGDTLLSGPLRNSLTALHDLFEQAPELGSLIDPRAAERRVFQADLESTRETLADALAHQPGSDETAERSVAAQGMARAAELLAERYTLVVTNVPYLARGKQSDVLKTFAAGRHADAKADLATLFVSRSFDWLAPHGAQAVVTPQNWLFLTSYHKLRERLLQDRTWNLVARLGEHAFEDPQAAGAFPALNVLSADCPAPGWRMAGLDVSAPRGQRPIRAAEKAALLRRVGVASTSQHEQLQNPDAHIVLEPHGHTAILGGHATCLAGILNGDSPRFRRVFWEFPSLPDEWVFQQSTVRSTVTFGGRTGAIYFDEVNGHLRENALIRRRQLHDSDQRGNAAWHKWGVGISQMHSLPVTIYTGEKFDSSTAIVFSENQELTSAIWAFCSDTSFAERVRRINQKVSVENGYFEKLPFDRDHWQKVAAEKYPNGLPEPYSDDPTQWIFHGHPCGSVGWDEETKRTAHGPWRTDPAVLQIAVARLAGYRWPAEHDPEMRLAGEMRTWVERCRALNEFADPDGIVCLPPVGGEPAAADRLRRLLAAAYGADWSAATERRLLAATAGDAPPADSLEAWLRDRFFAEHCKQFRHRPFVWHVWDGRRDGFGALVHYHRLAGPDGAGRRTLEALTYSYLGDWVARQEADQRDGKEGADGRLAAALDLQQQLERILEGEPTCDLFVRWKPLAAQPIGWTPDLNDGVRVNLRPFLSAEIARGGRAGAGVLRWKPNVAWGKDRGKEPASLRPREEYPWFWRCPGAGTVDERTDFTGGDEFDGNRWNNLHYTNAVKRGARATAEPETDGQERAGSDAA